SLFGGSIVLVTRPHSFSSGPNEFFPNLDGPLLYVASPSSSTRIVRVIIWFRRRRRTGNGDFGEFHQPNPDGAPKNLAARQAPLAVILLTLRGIGPAIVELKIYQSVVSSRVHFFLLL